MLHKTAINTLGGERGYEESLFPTRSSGSLNMQFITSYEYIFNMSHRFSGSSETSGGPDQFWFWSLQGFWTRHRMMNVYDKLKNEVILYVKMNVYDKLKNEVILYDDECL